MTNLAAGEVPATGRLEGLLHIGQPAVQWSQTSTDDGQHEKTRVPQTGNDIIKGDGVSIRQGGGG